MKPGKIELVHYPSSMPDFLCPCSEGAIQLTFISPEEVVQISPILDETTPDCIRNVLEKWIIQENSMSKTLLIKRLIEKIKTSLIFVKKDRWRIGLPLLIDNCLNYTDHSGAVFPCLVTNFIPGTNLETLIKEDESVNKIEVFAALVGFLSVLHFLPLQYDKNEGSLLNYYERRISAIKRSCLWFRNSGVSADWNLIRAIGDKFLSILHKIILDTEKVTQIHGDFRPGNMIMSHKTKTLSIIDFEQGLCGGDWLCDLRKLKVIPSGISYQTDGVSSIMQERYDTPQKDTLVYLKDHGLLDKRVDLLRFDSFSSTLILRLSMGWTLSGEETRGIEFITGLLRKVEERTQNYTRIS